MYGKPSIGIFIAIGVLAAAGVAVWPFQRSPAKYSGPIERITVGAQGAEAQWSKALYSTSNLE